MLFLKTIETRFQGFWEKLKATDLGTGSTGGGTKYLADDMTWKTVISGGGSSGPDVDIDCGSFTAPNDNTSIDCGTF
jgi:hypothetical protein